MRERTVELALISTDAVIVSLREAKRLLSLVRDIEAAKQVIDIARAVLDYATRQKLSAEIVLEATAIKTDAIASMGEFLQVADKAKGGLPYQLNATGSRAEPVENAPTLAEVGITKKESMNAQAIAALKSSEPEAYQAVRSGKVSITKAVASLKARERQQVVVPSGDEDPCDTVSDLSQLVAQGLKFGCIYADPPWQYGNQGTRAATNNHYSTMCFDDIAALPVGELAAEKCHLHLWTTNAFIRDAFKLLDGWGFEFKSTFVWAKTQLGIGNYWRCSHEIMLLGVRGKLTFPPTNIKSWIEAERTKHSAKPEAVRALIERVSPGPRLEMFGRKVSPGWTVWGNQIKRSLLDPQEV